MKQVVQISLVRMDEGWIVDVYFSDGKKEPHVARDLFDAAQIVRTVAEGAEKGTGGG